MRSAPSFYKSNSLFLLLLQDHIYKLMKSDSYARFLRSNVYQDLLMARKKVRLGLVQGRSLQIRK